VIPLLAPVTHYPLNTLVQRQIVWLSFVTLLADFALVLNSHKLILRHIQAFIHLRSPKLVEVDLESRHRIIKPLGLLESIMITPTTFLVCKFLLRQIIRLPRIISVEFLLATSGSLLHHGLIYKVKVVTKSAFRLKLTICSSSLPYFLIFRIVILATEHIHILVKTGQIILLYNRILEL